MSIRTILGRTNLEVSPICFGTWQLSPRFWGDQPEEKVRQAMHQAFELGINFFDTADAYGDGDAEKVLGKFIAEIPRDQVVIATKVFNHFNPDATRYPDLSPAYIQERCDLQLKRLQCETIDLYLLHFYDQLTPLNEIAATLEKLKKSGKIRQYGVSNHTVEQLRANRQFGAYNAVQPPYSLVNTGIENDLLPYCQAEKLGVMIYSPMHKGLLTGKYAGEETFTDFRQYHPDFQGERFKQITTAVHSLQPLAEKYEMSLYQLILTATLMHPAIQVAVVGIKTADQIKEAAGCMGKTLSRPDYYAIRKALTLNNTRILDRTGGVK